MSDTINPCSVQTVDAISAAKWQRTITLMTSCSAARDKSKLIELIESLPVDTRIVGFRHASNDGVIIVLESAEWKSTANKPLEIYTCRQVLR